MDIDPDHSGSRGAAAAAPGTATAQAPDPPASDAGLSADDAAPARYGRRALLRTSAMAGAAVAVGAAAAACGAASGGGASGGGGGTTPGVPTVLAKTTDIPVGGGRIFPDRLVVVTQPVAGTFKGFSAVCTHQHCTVSSVSNGRISCPCHGSQYSIVTGAVVHPPATQPLPPANVVVQDGNVVLAG